MTYPNNIVTDNGELTTQEWRNHQPIQMVYQKTKGKVPRTPLTGTQKRRQQRNNSIQMLKQTL